MKTRLLKKIRKRFTIVYDKNIYKGCNGQIIETFYNYTIIDNVKHRIYTEDTIHNVVTMVLRLIYGMDVASRMEFKNITRKEKIKNLRYFKTKKSKVLSKNILKL